MLGSEATALFDCLGCHQLHLTPKRRINQLKVGKLLIVATLTKNASLRSNGTFAYLLRAHIRNISTCMCGYITSAHGHELSGHVRAHVNARVLQSKLLITPLSE